MRILIIDDWPLATLTLRTMLESAGFTVGEAEDGDQIVRPSGRVKADLVLCDIFMPSRDGLEVIRELREDDVPRHSMRRCFLGSSHLRGLPFFAIPIQRSAGNECGTRQGVGSPGPTGRLR
jgi:CheY-like chemotaxis protein